MLAYLSLEASIEGGIMTIDVRNTAQHGIIATLELNDNNPSATLEVPFDRNQEYAVVWIVKSKREGCRYSLDIIEPVTAGTRIRKTLRKGACAIDAVTAHS